MRDGDNPSYIVEFVVVGKAVKVTAFDPATLTEASIIAPAMLPRKLLAKQAARKLAYVLRKKAGEA